MTIFHSLFGHHTTSTSTGSTTTNADPVATVDGENTGEVMAPGYNDALGATDGGGDIIDGADGVNDVILGNGGDDTIDAGQGDDIVFGDNGPAGLGGGTPGENGIADEGGVATLLVWDLSQLSFTGGNPFPNSTSGLSDSSVDDIKMTINANATPVAVGIQDGSSSHFNDGDLSQDLVNNETINGVSGGAGDRFTPEYSYRIQNDETGEIINVYAVELNSNQVVGFVSDAPMELGATYSFLDNTSTHPSVSYSSLADVYIVPDNGVADGEDGNDVINGGAGADTIFGEGGDDLLDGGAGDDVIFGDSADSASAGGAGVSSGTLGDGPGSTGGSFGDRSGGQTVYDGNHSFTTDAFFLGNDIPVLSDANDDVIDGVTYGVGGVDRNGNPTDREINLQEISFTGAQRSFYGQETVERSDLHGANDQISSDGTNFQDIVSVNSGDVKITMNDGQVFNTIEVTFAQDADGNTFMFPSDGQSPHAFNAFLNLLNTNDSGIASFEINNISGTQNGIFVLDGNWADGQVLETTDGDGGDDTIIGGEGADTMFGEGGDDTFVVSSAADGAGDVISGGNGPDETTDTDVLDLRGAGDVTINDAADANDAGATAGTVTFEDGSTLTFEGIEEILQDAPADGVVDGEETGEVMGVGYDDSNAPTDGGGDEITDNADVIDGNGGDDTISAGGGDDVVDGGGDDDLIDGGAGDDTLSGGVGTDTLAGGEGADVIDGGGDDDDILLGAGDTGLGGSGDDVFTVDPSLTGDAPITVIGGELGEDLSDPTNGGDGDVLDLRGLGPVDVAFDPTDPEAGTATYTNDAGDPVTITFSEIEEVLTDGPDPDGVIDGEETGEVMAPGYDDSNAPTDGGGDIIDGPDGLDDDIQGLGGDDTIDGGLGDDTISGGGEDDLLDGNEGNDIVAGDEGSDTISGGAGDDTLLGGDGDDDIAVGDNDVADGGAGDDVFTVDPAQDSPIAAQIDGGSDGTDGNPAGPENGDAGDVLDLSDRPEDLEVTFEPNPESGEVDGLDGDNLADITFDEIEEVITGSGDDVIDGTLADDPINVATNEGNDTIAGGAGDDTLDGGDDDDLIAGGAGDDLIDGGEGNDTLIGGEGDDTIIGGLQDDDIVVGAGDTAFGQGGDDVFTVDPSLTGDAPITVVGGETQEEDIIDPTNGGDGDVLDLRGLGPVDVVFDPTDPEAGTATYTNDDGQPVTITFSEIEEVLTDGPGPDGVVDGEETGEVMGVGYDDSNAPTDGGGDEITDQADVIDGNGGDDTISAGGGDDVVDGGGDDDLIDGGAGDDTLSGGVGTDTLDGGEGADVLEGGAGDDDITVGAGDVADGGSGDDDFTIDPVNTDGPGTIVINGGADATSGLPDDLANGNDGDTLDFTGLDNVTILTPLVDDGTGSFSGVVSYDNPAGDTVVVDFTEIENVLGLPDGVVDGEETGEVMAPGYDDSNAPTDGGGDVIDGPDGVDDVIDGLGGDDTIDGGLGDDVIDGGDDDDLLDGNVGDDTLRGGDGTDTLEGGEGADLLDGGGDDDDILLGAGDTGLGGSGDDVFTVDPSLTGDAPITVIGGELGEDLSDPTNGGDGDVLDLRGLGPVDVAFDPTDPEAGTATYTNDDGQPVTITFSEIEEVLTDGPSPDGVVDGTDGPQVMGPGFTDPQGDEIDGADGIDDIIEGNGGDDTIDAGAGDDIVDGGANDDLIDGGDGNDDILGNDGSDTLSGGEGDDTLAGGDGDDDIAVGGNDVAEGGAGDDVFTIDPEDQGPVEAIIDGGTDGTDGNPAGPENGDEGDVLDLSDQTDDLEVTLSPNPETGTVDGLDGDGTPDILFDEIEEILTGEGDDTIDGTDAQGPVVADGGDGDDDIDGGAGDDELSGGDGNDTLDGGEGEDVLDGGLDDDDIILGAGDTGLGGEGDDEFTIDPTVSGDAPITVVGGETGEEDVIDPTNNPGGRIGDVLDLRGLDDVTVDFDPTDDEAGVATFTNDDGEEVTIQFSEIEEVLTDGADPDGIVDGEEFGELMGPDYSDANAPTDGGGDEIDGNDGVDDVIEGNGGDDTIDAALGDDLVDGGAGDDILSGGEGNDTLYGDQTEAGTGGGGEVAVDDVPGADHTVMIWDLSDVDTSGTRGDVDPFKDGTGAEATYKVVGATLSLAAGASPVTAGVDDNDDNFKDSDWNQVLSDDVTIDGLSADAGDRIAPEYAYTIRPEGSSDPADNINVYAVELGTGNEIVGFATDKPLTTGEDYTFVGKLTSFPDVAFDDLAKTYFDPNAGGDVAPVGEQGDDWLDGGEGDDQLFGWGGSDTLDGGEGSDMLMGGDDDDDFLVGAGDTALGESGDDQFVIDPSVSGTDGITIVGGETGEDLSDPTNGGAGDVLDLRDLGPVDLVFDPTDPEAGTATYTNGAGEQVTITFSEIETVLTDGPTGDGVVDGDDTGQAMTPGFTDPQGDEVDGTDGVDDIIEGNGGDDTIDAGLGNDIVDGGTGDDLIDGGDGDDDIFGGAGSDTIAGGEGDDTIAGGGGDDDIAVGGNDVAEGGLGDDVFTIDPDDDIPTLVQIDGGSDGTTGAPAGPENGDEGDVLDLSDRPEDLTVVFSPNPETGIVNGLDTDTGSDILFDEIEKVLTGDGEDLIDGTNADGPLDVDAGDGDDSLFGGDGGDDLSGGAGDDLIDGGEAGDMLDGGDGNDTISGGGGDDTIMGGAGDDDILVDEGDFAMGGAGDDEFIVDPNGAGQTSIRVVGGEDDEEDVIDPTNNPGGRIGDVLDLRGVEVLDLTFDPTDPTGESGIATILNGAGNPVVLEFSEIENVLLPDPGNTAPTARNDNTTTQEATQVVFNVLDNDDDPDGDNLTLTSASLVNPALGSLSFAPDGNVTFTPAAGVTGPVEIDYSIDDGNGGSDEAVLTVSVQPSGGGNSDPIVVGDELLVAGDGSKEIDVLANDDDPDGDTLTVTAIEGQSVQPGDVVDLASGAQVIVNDDGTLTYNTNGAFDEVLVGQDEFDVFDYTASDGNGGSADGSVDVEICGATNTIDTIADRVVPDNATFTIAKVGKADYTLTLDNAGVALDGDYEKAYCVDFDAPITALRTGAEMNAELDVIGSDAVDYVSPGQNQYAPELEEDLDNIGWILDQDFGSQGYTETEIQAAIWGITNVTVKDVIVGGFSPNDDLTPDQLATLTPSKLVETIDRSVDGSSQDKALEIYERALLEGDGYEAEEAGDIVALLVTPDGTDNNVQPFVIGVDFEDLEEEPDCLL